LRRGGGIRPAGGGFRRGGLRRSGSRRLGRRALLVRGRRAGGRCRPSAAAAAGLAGGLDLLLRDAARLLPRSRGAGRSTLGRGGGRVPSARRRGATALIGGRGGALRRGQGGALVAQHQARGEQLEVQARRGGAAHRRQRLVHQVAALREVRRSEQRGLAAHALELVGRDLRQQIGAALRDRGQHDQVPHPLQQVLDEAPRLVPGGQHVLDRGVERGRVPLGDGRDGGVQQRRVGETQQRDRGREVQAVLAR